MSYRQGVEWEMVSREAERLLADFFPAGAPRSIREWVDEQEMS